MAHRQPPASQVGLDLLREPQQPQTVRDRRAILADPLRKLFLRPREFRQKLLIGLRRLDRVQVLAQEVLDERELDALRVSGLAHDRGNPIEAGLARRPPAAFARDQLIGASNSADDDRLNHAGRLDRSGELVQRGEVEDLSRLIRVHLDLVDRHVDEGLSLCWLRGQ